MRREKNIKLTPEVLNGIDNWSESTFARAVLSKPNLEVRYQVPVGEKVIDFEVTNRNSHSTGKLVEVTSTSKDRIGNHQQKSRQRHAMQESGKPFTILGGEFLTKVQDALNKKS